MKAIVFHEYGGADKLSYEDVPKPTLGEGEVLVRVKACALNHLDIWARTGLEPQRVPLPHISGSDVAGELAEVGESSSGSGIGQKVLVSPGLSDWICEFCLSGKDNMCRNYKIIGYDVNGGYAEYVSVPKENVIAISEAISFDELAAFPLTYLTAWHMLVTKAQIKTGQKVLVLAAGSGVGAAAIQICKLFGAKVITTVGAEWKATKAKEIGADEVINRKEQDIVTEVKRLTDGTGVDVVVEHVGTSTWSSSLKSLTYGGKLAICGATSGYLGETDLRYIYRRSLTIYGTYTGTKAELLEVLRFLVLGKLRPVVDSKFPLERAAEAQRKMEESGHFGKIILNP